MNNKYFFESCVGNPPYQQNVGSATNKALAIQLFPTFMRLASEITDKYVSLVVPSRWFSGEGQDKSFPPLREYIKQHNNFVKIFVYLRDNDLFPRVTIGSIIYYLQEKGFDANSYLTEFREFDGNEFSQAIKRPLFEKDMDHILLMNLMANYLHKVINHKGFVSLETITTPRNPFGVPDVNKELEVLLSSEKDEFHEIRIQCAYERSMYIGRESIKRKCELINKWKVYTSKMNGNAGTLMDERPVDILGRSFVGEPNSICSHALISIGEFNKENEALNLHKYMCTRFLRFLVGFKKISQALYQNVYSFVPLQNFTKYSDIDWSQSIDDIDRQLYKKYNLTDDESAFIESMIKPMEE